MHYFAQTSHTVGGAFYRFWSGHGGLNAFGLPLTEPYREGGQTVQFFERTAFVLHGTSVTILPLGRTLTLGRKFPVVGSSAAGASGRYFAATKHTLTGRFLAYRLTHDGSVLLVAPISEPLQETNGDGSGRRYLVQYFENERLEYHPEMMTSLCSCILLTPRGLIWRADLGMRILRRQGPDGFRHL